MSNQALHFYNILPFPINFFITLYQLFFYILAQAEIAELATPKLLQFSILFYYPSAAVLFVRVQFDRYKMHNKIYEVIKIPFCYDYYNSLLCHLKYVIITNDDIITTFQLYNIFNGICISLGKSTKSSWKFFI